MCGECAVDGVSPTLCGACLAHLDRGPNLKHTKILSILLMLHGGLLLAAGISAVLFGGLLFDSMLDIPAGEQSPATEGLPGIFFAVSGGVGLAHAVPGVLQAWAGWKLLQYQGAALTWAAGVLGLFSLVGCYCMPSAFMIFAYLVFVMTRDDVRARIALNLPPASLDP